MAKTPPMRRDTDSSLYTAAMALANRYHVSMPIVEQINAVLFEGKTTKQALKELLVRDRVSEYRTLSW